MLAPGDSLVLSLEFLVRMVITYPSTALRTNFYANAKKFGFELGWIEIKVTWQNRLKLFLSRGYRAVFI